MAPRNRNKAAPAAMESWEDRIVDALRRSQGAGKQSELETLLVKTEKVMNAAQFEDALNALVKSKRVYKSRSGTLFVKNTPIKTYHGVVQGHRDGFGFLICDEDVADMYLTPEEMSKVLTGDFVEASVAGVDGRGRSMARIEKVLKRKLKTIVGRLVIPSARRKGLSAFVKPEDTRIARTFSVDVTSISKDMDQKIVVMELLDEGILPPEATGKVIEVLGNIDDPGMEMEIAVRKFGLPNKFSEENLSAVAKFSDHVTKSDLRNRVDLRDIPFVTIDGADARDFDDAVYCQPIPRKKGWFRLLVAIADVSHYVKSGSPIDKDAQLRTTSVYFPRKVIPMLPEELSNGLCSLNPHVDRCTMVCDAVVSPEGEVTAYQFYPAVINSAARLIYDNVWAALQDPNGPAAKTMEHVLGNVQDLYDLYKILLKSRELRGAMDFETVETYIVANDQGKIEKILPRERNDAHRLIEEMMLVANTCAADFLLKNNTPCLYRVHDAPSEDKLEKARAALKAFGLTLEGGDKPTAEDYRKVLDKAEKRPDKAVIQMILLRSMQQALYSPHNVGHYGLNYSAYAHFTSPIRRYPDLLVHRAIRGILSKRKYVPKLLVSPDEVDVPIQIREKIVSSDEEKKVPHIEVWEKLGLLCSAYERRADEASYDVTAWLKTYYMQQHIGETYQGVVTGVSPFAVFVTLDDLYVEGGIHISNLGHEYFEYDADRNCITGDVSGVKYFIGKKLRVVVQDCDLDARRIEFSLASVSSYDDSDDDADHDYDSDIPTRGKKRRSRSAASGSASGRTKRKNR